MRGNSEIKKIIRVYLTDSKKLENLKDIHEFKIFLLNFFHSFAHQSKILLFAPPIPPAFHSHTTCPPTTSLTRRQGLLWVGTASRASLKPFPCLKAAL